MVRKRRQPCEQTGSGPKKQKQEVRTVREERKVRNITLKVKRVDISNMYNASSPVKSFSKKLKLQTTTHSLQFTEKSSEYDGPFEELLDSAIEELFRKASHGYQKSDLFGVEFWWPGMSSEKFVSFRPIDSFEPSAVRLEMHRLFQSGSTTVHFNKKVIFIS